MTPSNPQPSRRSFFRNTGAAAAASALAGVVVPSVHAGEQNTIKVALVGCGGRGTGAAANALSVENGPIKLVAMADVFEDRWPSSTSTSRRSISSQIDVPEDRRFLGFDAYQKAMDCLDPGDVVILTTPPAFRWSTSRYAIDKGINTFMEKPVTVDGPTTRRMIELGEEAKEKNLKVGVGLMCRHCDARQELFDRIQDGEIGDLITLRSYRQAGGGGMIDPKPDDISELMYQIQQVPRLHVGQRRRDHGLHDPQHRRVLLDEGRLAGRGPGPGGPPATATTRSTRTSTTTRRVHLRRRHQAVRLHPEHPALPPGVRQLRPRLEGLGGDLDQLAHPGQVPDLPRPEHRQGRADLGLSPARAEPLSARVGPPDRRHPQGQPYNEVKRGAEASLVTAMGRMAAHTGRVVTFDEMLNHDHEFAPDVDKLTYDAAAPLQKQGNGMYPQPEPGLKRNREY